MILIKILSKINWLLIICFKRDAVVPNDYNKTVPDHRVIYKFMKNLFTAAQLTAECAIVTLVSLIINNFLKVTF